MEIREYCKVLVKRGLYDIDDKMCWIYIFVYKLGVKLQRIQFEMKIVIIRNQFRYSFNFIFLWCRIIYREICFFFLVNILVVYCLNENI